MNDNFCLQIQLGNASKIFSQNRSLDLKLMLILGVLIMTPAAALEIRTLRLYPLWRRLKNCFRTSPRKTALLFEEGSFNALALEHEWNEDSFAATVLIGRQPRQAVAAVHQFFNSELQARILCETASSG